jgi:hypothetical protein
VKARPTILILCALLTGRSGAQSDSPAGSVKQEFARCSAVFAGKVLAVRKEAGYETLQAVLPPSDSIHVGVLAGSVTVRVNRAWKRSRADTVVSVVTVSPWRIPFKIGKPYLIYGSWNPSRTAVHTDAYSRTRRLEDAREDLRELGPAIGRHR